jgi:hypothetical protein
LQAQKKSTLADACALAGENNQAQTSKVRDSIF